MAFALDGVPIFATRTIGRTRPPPRGGERPDLESLIRADYERCHPGETLADLKQRARFSKEDKGLLRDWTAVAARRAIVRAAGTQ